MWLKATVALAAIIIMTLIMAGCSDAGGAKTDKLKRIGFDRAFEMVNSENPPVIIDVRTPEEFNNELGHIHDSRLIPMQVTADSMAVYEQYKDSRILLVCRSGRRSGIVGTELASAGFVNVYNLEGELVVSSAWRDVSAQSAFDLPVELSQAVSGMYLCRLEAVTDDGATDTSVVSLAISR